MRLAGLCHRDSIRADGFRGLVGGPAVALGNLFHGQTMRCAVAVDSASLLALFRLRLFQRPNRGIGAFHFGKRHRLAADILIVLGRRSKTAGPDRRKPGAAEGKEHKPASAPPSNNGTPAKITRPTDRRGFAGQDGVGIHAKPSHDRTDAANDGAKLSAVVAAR